MVSIQSSVVIITHLLLTTFISRIAAQLMSVSPEISGQRCHLVRTRQPTCSTKCWGSGTTPKPTYWQKPRQFSKLLHTNLQKTYVSRCLSITLCMAQHWFNHFPLLYLQRHICHPSCPHRPTRISEVST